MVTAPNQLWCMDFEGYFLTGDGYRCDPFTITDAHSRFLIRCQAVARMDFAQVNAVCDAAMREYGMPERLRTDNGAPFVLSVLEKQAVFLCFTVSFLMPAVGLPLV
jgi:transposase InsO family protein